MASQGTDTDAGPSTEELPQDGGSAPGDKASEPEDQMENRRNSSPAASQLRRPQATVRGGCQAATSVILA